MNYTETDLYLAIKNNNLVKLVEILKQYNLTKYEFFNNKITFVSLAVISSEFWSLSIYLANYFLGVIFLNTKDAGESIIEKLVDHGADVNRLSYISYEWPVEGTVFKSFETALITATRHGIMKFTFSMIFKHAQRRTTRKETFFSNIRSFEKYNGQF